MIMSERVQNLIDRIESDCLNTKFSLFAHKDMRGGKRVFIQYEYLTQCTKSRSGFKVYKGRKWYLSEFMTDDEIIKTAYLAFEQAVKHEILEGFKVDGKILFNPHVDFEALLSVSDKEVTRTNHLKVI